MTAADEVAALISAALDCYLATVDVNDHPRVRPFGPALSLNDHLWFVTEPQKKMYVELQNNPDIEICSYNSKDRMWVRVSGKAVLANDLSVKRKMFENEPELVSVYQNPENPICTIFYIEGQADFYNFTPSGSDLYKTITLT
jgi:uncharacterized pyridoxamine 5'-phosphate oxidase family protein